MPEMTYELFVRGAFSMHSNDMIARGGDAAQLASTTTYNLADSHPEDFDSMKIGTAYAMSAYITEIINSNTVSEADYAAMNTIRSNVLNAATPSNVIDLINQFRPLRDKYFEFPWNRH